MRHPRPTDARSELAHAAPLLAWVVGALLACGGPAPRPVAPTEARAASPATLDLSDPLSVSPDAVVATVDDAPVRWGAALPRVRAALPSLDDAPDGGADRARRLRQIVEEAIDGAVDVALVRVAAGQLRIEIDDAMIDEAVAAVAQQNNLTPEALYEALPAQDLTREAYREAVGDELRKGRLLAIYSASRGGSAPSEEALRCMGDAMLAGLRRRHRVALVVERTATRDPTAAPDPPPVALADVAFEGNEGLSDDALRALLAPLAVDGRVTLTREGVLDGDVRVALQRAYYDQGYLDITIDHPRASDAPCAPIARHDALQIAEGARYRVGAVRVRELDGQGREVAPLGGRPALARALGVTPGRQVARDAMARGVDAVRTLYLDAGYGLVEVEPNLTRHDGVADLDVVIRRGPVVVVDRVEVRGNERVTEQAIRAAAGFTPGQRYSERAWRAAVARVGALAGVAGAELWTELVTDHPERLVIFVEVRERPPQETARPDAVQTPRKG